MRHALVAFGVLTVTAFAATIVVATPAPRWFTSPALRSNDEHVHTFCTTAADLVVLHDRLTAHEVTHVAMEGTGV
jgi:hypothetical protein